MSRWTASVYRDRLQEVLPKHCGLGISDCQAVLLVLSYSSAPSLMIASCPQGKISTERCHKPW